MIEGHGDDTFRYGDKVCHNFSTNICSAVDHSALTAHLAKSGDCLTTYPEPTPSEVEALLAGLLGIEAGEVMVTNGATEAIYLTAHLLQGRKSAIVVPTFREYQDACRLYGHEIEFVNDVVQIDETSDAVWLCNPNNPDGRVMDKKVLLASVDRQEQTDRLWVIDQAYADYTALPLISPGEAVSRNNVILLHSLTKRFAVPGLRIGYAIGNRSLMDRLRALRMPWSVNSLAIEGAKFLLAHADDYRIDADGLHSEAVRLGRGMEEMGIAVSPTDCNFILCRLPEGSASTLKEYMVEHHGILIRDASNFEGLDGRYFRVAAQTPQENDMFLNALRQWMKS